MQEDDRLRLASSDVGHFASLFLFQSIIPNLIEDFHGNKEMPYNYCCPLVKKDIQRKVCKECNICFAFLTYLKEHQQFCTVVPSVPKVRPVRIAAKRQRELLAIILNHEKQEAAEWLEEDMLDIDDISLPDFDSNAEHTAPVFTVEEHLRNPWQSL